VADNILMLLKAIILKRGNGRKEERKRKKERKRKEGKKENFFILIE
jgi:hypothetical protein